MAVVVYGVRTALPLTPGHAVWWARLPFGLLVLTPGALLLWWRMATPVRYRRTLLGVAAANIYVTAAILFGDATRLASAAASLGMAGIAFILYASARAKGRT